MWLIAHRRKPFSLTRPEVYKALGAIVFTESSGGCGLLLTDGSPLVRPALRFIKALAPLCLRRAPGGVAYCSLTEALLSDPP